MTDARATPYRIMAVCHGNICRSPMAAVVLRQRFAEAGWSDRVEVESSGLSDEEEGNPVDQRALTVLERHGYHVGRHRARQLEPAWISDFDLVLGMDARQVRRLRAMVSDGDGSGIVRLFRSFDAAVPPGTPERELGIDDPWYGGRDGFEVTLALLEAGADGIVDHVRQVLEFVRR